MFVTERLRHLVSTFHSFHCGISVCIYGITIAGVYLPPRLSPQQVLAELEQMPSCPDILLGDLNARFNNPREDNRSGVLLRALHIHSLELHESSVGRNSPDHAACTTSPARRFTPFFSTHPPPCATDHTDMLLVDAQLHPPDPANRADLQPPAVANPGRMFPQPTCNRFHTRRLAIPEVSAAYTEILSQLSEVIPWPADFPPSPAGNNAFRQLSLEQQQHHIDVIYTAIVGVLQAAAEMAVGQYNPVEARRSPHRDPVDVNSECTDHLEAASTLYRKHSGVMIQSSGDLSPHSSTVLHYTNIFSQRAVPAKHQYTADAQSVPKGGDVDSAHVLRNFSPFSVSWAIGKYPKGKSPGHDSINIALLRPIMCSANPNAPFHPLLLSLSRLFRWCVTTGLVPSQWKFSLTKPIPKEEGTSACTIDKTRPISLTPVLRRLFEKLLLRCILLKPHSQLSDKELRRGCIGIGKLHGIQGGFRSGHSTSLHLLSLQEWYSRGRKVLGFVDVKAAFDSVDHDICLARFKHRLPVEGLILLPIMRSLFVGTSFCAVVNGEWTVHIDRDMGLVQGSLCSPLMFTIFIDPLAHNLQPDKPSDTHPLRALLLADDIALMARTADELQHLLTLTHDWLTENGLQCNHSKCAVIGNSGPDLFMGGTSIPSTTSYTYLGLPISSETGGIDFDSFCSRVYNKANRFFSACIPLSIAHNWSEVCRLNVFKVFILSRYQYCGALLRVWLSGHNVLSPQQPKPPPDLRVTLRDASKGADSLRSLTDRATRWIFKLPAVDAPPVGPGGFSVLRSIAGLPGFIDRLDELACFFRQHIVNSDIDNPIKSIPPTAPPYPTNMFLWRLNTVPLVKEWIAAEKRVVEQQQAQAALRARNGREPLPLTMPPVKSFILKTRQDRLDERGRLHLAARVMARARKDTGSFDRVMKIRDPDVRTALLRWRRGIWGVGARCPVCNDSFFPSHVARCKLLHDEWGHCEVDTFGDIHDLRDRGAVRAVLNGYGCVDMCLNHGEFKDAVLMLKDLCKKLEGIHDWKGVFVRPP